MARAKKVWSVSVGSHGTRVVAFERKAGGPLWLRWWVPAVPKGQWEWRPLKHTDRAAAEQSARTVAASLMVSSVNASTGRASLSEVFSYYRDDVTSHTKGQGPREATRRFALWSAFLGADRDVASIDFPTIERFIRARRENSLTVAGYELRADPSDGTIGADIIFLMAALNHATRVVRPNGARLLLASPLKGFAIPRSKNPRRPVASYDRYLAVIAHADAVDPQKLFGAFMGLVEGLGWRVSAICALTSGDVDVAKTPAAPFGRIHKRAATDKEGVDHWLPMSESVRAAVDTIRARNATVFADWPLFPAPLARTEVEHNERDVEIPKCWTRFHARALLTRAEKAAKLDPLQGSDFHAYRRAWASSRKHLPTQDVAEVGGWRDLRTLERAYMQTDSATILSVVMEPRKLRDVKADEAAG